MTKCRREKLFSHSVTDCDRSVTISGRKKFTVTDRSQLVKMSVKKVFFDRCSDQNELIIGQNILEFLEKKFGQNF